MKLTYRGIPYTPASSHDHLSVITRLEGEVIGKYRGVDVHSHESIITRPCYQSQLNYRGVTYRTDVVGYVAPQTLEWQNKPLSQLATA